MKVLKLEVEKLRLRALNENFFESCFARKMPSSGDTKGFGMEPLD